MASFAGANSGFTISPFPDWRDSDLDARHNDFLHKELEAGKRGTGDCPRISECKLFQLSGIHKETR